VLLPGYLSHAEQRELIKSALEVHAVSPNENNLDTHYNVPQQGLWPTWKAFNEERIQDPQAVEPVIDTKRTTAVILDTGSQRTLIENTPASVDNFEEIRAVEKPPPTASATLTPLPLSSLISKLRWSNIGHFYHWGTKSYEFDRPQVPMPQDVKKICRQAVRAIPWEDVWMNGIDVSAGEWETPSPDYRCWHKTYGR